MVDYDVLCRRIANAMIIVGAVVTMTAIVGGHYLQYITDHETASICAALTGAFGGACLMQGVVIRLVMRLCP